MSFGVETLEFLSCKISSMGIEPSEERIQIITNFEKPNSVKKLQKFLGMINYYHRFIPKAEILSSIYEVLNKSIKNKNNSIEWSKTSDESFELIKSKFASKTLLTHIDFTSKISVSVDASNIAVGSVLQQTNNNKLEPIAFFSRKLSPCEIKYSTFDRELLAIYLSIKHFRHFLEGREFTICTDHKPLVFALNSKTDRSPRQTRHLEYIAQFTSNIVHVPGSANGVADTLSRIPEIETLNHNHVDINKLNREQEKDLELKRLTTHESPHQKNSLKLEKFLIKNIEIWCVKVHKVINDLIFLKN